MDANEDINDEGGFFQFANNNDFVDVATQFDLLLSQDPTYIHSNKRMDCILLSPNLVEIAIKAGHHNFHQHLVSDHKGVYVHFRAEDLFATETIDRSQIAYRILRLYRRDIVENTYPSWNIYSRNMQSYYEQRYCHPDSCPPQTSWLSKYVWTNLIG